MTRADPKKKPATMNLSDEPIVDRFRMRGQAFVLTEVTIEEYDDLHSMFTTVSETTGEESLNEDGFVRALTLKALVSPRWSATQLASKGTRMVRTLEARTRVLHLAPEPVDTSDIEPEVEVEGDDSPNAG